MNQQLNMTTSYLARQLRNIIYQYTIYGQSDEDLKYVFTHYVPLPVLEQPSPKLKEVSRSLEVEDYFFVSTLEYCLEETMKAKGGVGLAAPQIGINVRCILAQDETGKNYFLVNPVITKFSDDTCVFKEGCLSVPNVRYDRTRPASITVEHVDVKSGELKTLEAKGLLARVIQHEIDHLDGKLFIDGISRLKLDMLKKKGQKLNKRGYYNVG